LCPCCMFHMHYIAFMCISCIICKTTIQNIASLGLRLHHTATSLCALVLSVWVSWIDCHMASDI
jgi:hypothetical protein